MQKNNNLIIRKALLYKGYTQNDLAKIMKTSPSEITRMLKYELDQKQQEEIAKLIEES